MISGPERWTAGLAAVLWLTLPAAAANDFEAIVGGIATPRDVAIPFVEQRGNALLSEPLELSGTVEFSSDGVLSKTIEAPFSERVIISRDSLELTRDGRTRRLALRRKDDVRQFYVALRALLEGDAPTLRRLFEIESSSDADCWRLVLTPAAQPLAGFIDTMVISGRAARVLEVRTEQPGNDWQSLSFGEQP